MVYYGSTMKTILSSKFTEMIANPSYGIPTKPFSGRKYVGDPLPFPHIPFKTQSEIDSEKLKQDILDK